jgi:type I restriction enzyme S subunit
VSRDGILRILAKNQQFCDKKYAEKYHKNTVDQTYTIVVLRDLVPSGPNIGLIVKIPQDDFYLLAQGVYGFKVNEGFLPEYLIQFSNSTPYRHIMNEIMVGSTQVHITNTAFKNLLIPLPPLSEQKRIAKALSDIDELITALDKLITKKRYLKQGAMQQLLTGKTRLPGFTGAWEVRRLGEVAEINRGASPRPIDSPKWYSTQSNVGWVRIADVSEANGKILLKTKDYLSKQGISQSRFISQGSLIMSICATVGLPIITGIEVCIHDGFVGFDKISKDMDLEFLFYTLKELEKSFKSAGQVGSQSNLNSEIIRQYFITIPPLPEQKAIAKILTKMDEEIEALEKKRDKYKKIKQGMMSVLLTGRIRLM